MREDDCIAFLRWALPRLRFRWVGFRRVRRQVCRRLGRRLHELELNTLEGYRDRLESDPGEWVVLDSLCRVTISRLYRDRAVFDVIGDVILPERGESASLRSRRIRCWCAGCASGEEVYTLRILWDLKVQPEMPHVQLEVIGTDADAVVLQRAERACFSSGSLKEVPAHWRDLAFERHDHDYCVHPVHREGITFERQDIRFGFPAGPFDLVFCRNLVFTYFEIALQRAVLERIAAVVREGGYLVIGAHEQLPNGNPLFEPLVGSRQIFRKVRRERKSEIGEAAGSP
jgi:chemotaxis protein methyltransferase CheR